MFERSEFVAFSKNNIQEQKDLAKGYPE